MLEALEVDKAVVIGNSMGGWLALNFAATYPERTSALALLAPSGIVKPKQDFLKMTADVATNRDSAKAVNDAVMGDTAMPKEVLEFLRLVVENFNPFTGALPVLTDEQMHKLTMPVLYIAGVNDVTTDVVGASMRLLEFVPHATVNLTEGAHVITTSADKILPFLTKELHPNK